MQTIKNYLSSLLKEALIISEEVQQKFSSVPVDLLYRKPSSRNWSAAECFKHLIISNGAYFPAINEYLKAERKIIDENMPFKPTMSGRLLTKSLSPGSKLKTKTSSQFYPDTTKIEPDIINKFLEQHNEIIGMIENSAGIDISKTRLISPFLKYIKYNLGDCYKIILTHDKRHIAQANRAMQQKLALQV